MPPCWMRGATFVRRAPGTACSSNTARCASVVTSSDILVYRKPELLARQPNQVWTWDITKLRGPLQWTYFYL